MPHPIGRTQTGAYANVERGNQRGIKEVARLKAVLDSAVAEARRYAESYPQSSDGRNTFLMFADWLSALVVKVSKEQNE